MFNIKLILGIMSLVLVCTVGFNLIMTSESKAQRCDGWVDYFVDEDGDGTCTVGIGGDDFLDGTGVAKCTFARNGNINCTCKGEHIFPLESVLIFDRDDNCCITIAGGDIILSEITMGLGTPSGIMNATCKYRPE